MKQKTTFRKLRFTLVELIMAMAVFSILALIMMRFYSSAQQVWSKSSQRSEMYNDAHIALDLMARELQAAMYSNDDTPQGIYPFWFQKIKNISSPALAPDTDIDRYYPSVSGSQIQLTQLNFIAATDLRPANTNTNICEIRYSFVPAGMYLEPDTGIFKLTPAYTGVGVAADDESQMAVIDAPRASNNKVIREGWLVRSCTGDMVDNGTGGGTPHYVSNTKWNFASYPRRDPITNNKGSSQRIYNIWSGATTSEKFQPVIPNIYALKFTCYYLDINASWKLSLPIRYVSSTVCNQPPGDWPYSTTETAVPDGGLVGNVLPDAVKIDLSMMSPADWREWKTKIDYGDIPGAEKIKLQRMRTFSKTVFINNR